MCTIVKHVGAFFTNDKVDENSKRDVGPMSPIHAGPNALLAYCRSGDH